MKIGIRGPIGSGKSTITELLSKKLDLTIIDADEIAHMILYHSTVKEDLIKTFGKDIFIGKEISRKKLGEIVFRDKEKLNELNNIFSPILKTEIIARSKQYKNTILDMAILKQYALNIYLDIVIFVDADEKIRVKRLLKRGFELADIKNKIAMQNPAPSPGEILFINNFNNLKSLELELDNILNTIS